ncbi:MAG: hypothetical protein H6753_06035 [Candidatus Omnitrophica bacterium]|nr:hypothetical protein [Candidatus Omnitrophota bacterium]
MCKNVSILSLEDISSAEANSTDTPTEMVDALNDAGLKVDLMNTFLILKLNDAGKEMFSEITSQNIGKRMVIFIDGDLVLAADINEPIVGGEISFHYSSLDKAKSIAERINQAKQLHERNP